MDAELAGPRRPATVTAALCLIYGQIAYVVCLRMVELTRPDLWQPIYAALGAPDFQQLPGYFVGSCMGTVVSVLLAVYVGRGANVARVIVWIWTIVGWLLAIGSLAFLASTTAERGTDFPLGFVQALSPGYRVAVVASAAIDVLLTVGILALLVTPSANRFFRMARTARTAPTAPRPAGTVRPPTPPTTPGD